MSTKIGSAVCGNDGPATAATAPHHAPSALRRRGFTLIEVMIAMGIFLAAMLAIAGLYFQNLRLARMAQDEIILSMIQRDVMSRNLVVATVRAGEERGYVRSNVGSVPSAAPVQFTVAGFGQELDTNPGVMTKGWGVRNVESWEAVSGLVWGRSNPATIHDVPLYTGYCFSVRPMTRHFLNNGKVSDWAAVGNTPGLALEDCQFTDWDGYGLVDMDGDGEPETDRGNPAPSPGPLIDSALADTTYGASPYRLFYNSNNMSRYVMKLRVRVMWNYKDEDYVKSLSDTDLKAEEDAGRRVCSHTSYYFSVFNPDVVKRWQP
ncbi:MAG TPA: prepilin-type N-terminal cleavage/methylation domain-containing protein [Planctomycetota bacterium]|nr:prepilin-type N-terminal cleavage/methylation domain-containing protein [Planctomycetota bacterium]